MIIYLDTETTGLCPGQICQLSYLMQNKDGVSAKNFYFTVDKMEYGAYLIHNLSQEKLKKLSLGRRFADNIDEIEGDFKKADLIVSHNVSFDFSFLREEFLRAGRTFFFKESFCTMKQSVAVCKIPRGNGRYKYPKLSELTAHLGVGDAEILSDTKRLFGLSGKYHDARFDATAVYLAANYGTEREEAFKKLKDFL